MHRFAQTTALAALLITAFGASLVFTPTQSAVAQAAERPCRLTWVETTFGGDSVHTEGTINFGPLMRQNAGSYMAWGSGSGQVTMQPGTPGCATIDGSPFNARFTAMLVSHGDSAEIDIIATTEDSPVTVGCGAYEETHDVTVSVPPTVTLPLRTGTTPFDYTQGSGARRAGTGGEMSLQMCAS